MKRRTERDPLGEVSVPADAYYGAQTQRAVENFQISGLRAAPELVRATVLIKKSAAEANRSLGRLPADIAGAIIEAAAEVLSGRFVDQFVVDVYQAGAGTSHNMNVNEVLANRAAELLGGGRGDHSRVHPNDHVNMGQSTNDVFPAATRLAILIMLEDLLASARALEDGLRAKSREFADVMKTGRTHLQDAVPMTLGQEFGGYAENVARGADDVARTAEQLTELNLGATAVGTGLNAGEDFERAVIENLARSMGLLLRPAANRFRVTQSMGDVLAYSGALRRLAVEVGKIASDLRLLSMGPRAGIAEIALPPVQPGSSIMPGKVNPSIPEMVNQVCFQVMGCDLTVAVAAEAGQLELNVMMPVIAWNTLHATRIMHGAMRALQDRCVAGLRADRQRSRELLDRSTAVATALSPYIGYEATAEIAKESIRTGQPIHELVRKRRLLSDRELDAILSVEAMTSPGVAGAGKERGHAVADRGGAVGADRKRHAAHRSTAAARTPVSAGEPGAARSARPRGLAAPRPDHGRTGDRRRQRRR
jgi:aspartate ammonia-lyase